jgi:hypothetical protein
MNRALFLITFAAIGALAFGWWTNYQNIKDAETEKITSFIGAGPRFTAQDGQKLCERIAELEKHSIGFQKSGIKSPPCDYFEK